MRVLLDVDGVIADFASRYCEILNRVRHGGPAVTPADVTTWEFEDALRMTRREVHVVEDQISQPGFARTLEPYPDAVDAVKRIAARHEVAFVTHGWESSPTWDHDRRRWLQKHFGQTLGRDVTFTRHKDRIRGDWMIDDRPSYALSWAQAWPDGVAVLWSRPWNENLRVPGVIRTRSWEWLVGALEVAGP